MEKYKKYNRIIVTINRIPKTNEKPDRLIYLEHEEEEPFVKEPLGGVPPLGSLRVGSLSVIAELTKSEVYRRRIWSLNIVPKLCALFKQRMGYLLKFAPDRSVNAVTSTI